MAPEMFKGNYGPEVDVYAFALILFELVRIFFPFTLPFSLT